MKTRCSRSFDCYVDTACLAHLESPINLKTHWHEELVFRTAEELHVFQKITSMPIDDDTQIEARRDSLRNWYDKAIERKMGDFDNQIPYKDLTNYDTLFDEMRKYDRVVFFGGCSLTILHHILEQEPALGKKVEYYQQGVCISLKVEQNSVQILNPYDFRELSTLNSISLETHSISH